MKCSHYEFIKYQRSKEIDIDTTNKCLLNCPTCIRQTPWGKDKIKKSYDISLKDITTISKCKDYLHFCGQISDPIYHSNFLDVLTHCQKIYGIDVETPRVQVATNGFGKSMEWWKEAFERSKWTTCWRFGLDFIYEENNIYRQNQKMSNIIEVMKMGAKMGLVIKWQYILFKHNLKYVEEAKQIASKNGIFFQTSSSSRMWNDRENPMRPSDEYVTQDSQNRRQVYTPKVDYYKEHYPKLHWKENGLIDSNNMTW